MSVTCGAWLSCMYFELSPLRVNIYCSGTSPSRVNRTNIFTTFDLWQPIYFLWYRKDWEFLGWVGLTVRTIGVNLNKKESLAHRKTVSINQMKSVSLTTHMKNCNGLGNGANIHIYPPTTLMHRRVEQWWPTVNYSLNRTWTYGKNNLPQRSYSSKREEPDSITMYSMAGERGGEQ